MGGSITDFKLIAKKETANYSTVQESKDSVIRGLNLDLKIPKVNSRV